VADQEILQQAFDAALAELKGKERKLVIEFLRDLHQRNAAIRAGYSEKTADVQASQILRKLKVRAAVNAGLALHAMPADEVLARLSQQARGSMAPFIRRDTDGDLYGFDLSATQPLHLLKKASVTRRRQKDDRDALVTVETVTIELYDAQAALALLGKHHKLFVDRTEVTGADGTPLFPDFEKALQKSYADDAPAADTPD